MSTTLSGDPTKIEALDVTPGPIAPPSVARELKAAIKKIVGAKNGTRNEVLNRLAFALGGYVPGGYLDRTHLESRLLAAIILNGGDRERDAEKIRAAVEAGMAEPRTPSEVPPTAVPGNGAGAAPSPEARAAGVLASDDRPAIYLTTELHENVDAAIRALASRDRNLFQRNGALVHVTQVTKEEANASPIVVGERRELVEGTPEIHNVVAPNLRERITRHARCLKFSQTSGGWRPSLPTDPVVGAVLARGEWSGVRVLDGIAETPFMRPDGSICDVAGYDAGTRYLYAPNSADFASVADRPTQADAKAAWRIGAETFQDFPWKSPGHASVPIAAAMTKLCRPGIVGSVPAFLFGANVPGAGKTLLTDAVAMISTGRAVPRKSYPRSQEELEKVLGSYALRGASLFCFDNIADEFGGGPLDAILTAHDTVELRVLGQSYVPTLVWRAVMLGTGNAIMFGGDTAHRVLLAELESNLEDPRTRTGFRHDDLLGWIQENRPRLVAALLTIVRAYVVAGKPDMGCPTWGSFRAWSRLIPHAIVFAGGADPMAARIVDESKVNDRVSHLATLLRKLPALIAWVEDKRQAEASRKKKTYAPAPGLTAAQILDALYPNGDSGEGPSPELCLAIEALTCPNQKSGRIRPTSHAFGKRLQAFKRRVVGGKRLDSVERAHDKVMLWYVEDVSA